MTKRYSEQFKQEGLNFVQTHPSLGIVAPITSKIGERINSSISVSSPVLLCRSA